MAGDGIPKVWSRYDPVLPFYDGRNWLEKFSEDVSPPIHVCPIFEGGTPPHTFQSVRVSIFTYARSVSTSLSNIFVTICIRLYEFSKSADPLGLARRLMLPHPFPPPHQGPKSPSDRHLSNYTPLGTASFFKYLVQSL